MKGKKQLLAELLSRSGALRGYGLLMQRRLRRSLVIFNYHRIRPTGPAQDCPFEEDVFDTDVATFEAQMRWLRDHTEVLSEDELIESLGARRSFERTASMVTFDDGYADNCALAYPVLRRLGVPATFFIPTGLVDMRRVGWWDIIAYLLKRTPRPALTLGGRSFILPAQRRQAADHFQEQMKLEPEQRTRDLVQRLAAACGVDLPDASLQDRELMTWDQVREVSRNGITIGSHTHSHRVLNTLDPADQEREMSLSRSRLEQELGRPVRSIAYPVGEQQHLSAETRDLAARAGYEVGFTYLSGTNRWGRIERMGIGRVAAPGQLEAFAATALLPEVFTLR